MNWTICLLFQLQRSTRSTGFCLACHCVDKIQQTLDTWRRLRLRSRFGPPRRHSLQHPVPNSVQSKQIPAFPQGEKELDHVSNSPTFLQAAQSIGFFLTCLRARGGLTHSRCLGATENKTVVQTRMQGLAIVSPPAQHGTSNGKTPDPGFFLPREGNTQSICPTFPTSPGTVRGTGFCLHCVRVLMRFTILSMPRTC